jgi:hypothetical protein
MPTNWRSKYNTLLRAQRVQEDQHETTMDRLRRENDVLRGLVRTYASDDVHWCYGCHIPMESDVSKTCQGCASVLCQECYQYDRDRECDQCGHELCPDHDIQTCGSCHERWCDNCRRKKMVECSHVAEGEDDPHVVCETCAQTCAGCSVTICRQCADICEFCDDYKNANVYCQECRSQHWCVECDMVVCTSCQPTCGNCRQPIVGKCTDCAKEPVHSLDECEDEMCRSCRQEPLVQMYGNLTFE